MPWVAEDALEIGAVYTLPNYRGKGLYPFSLETLVKNNDKTFFMIVESENIASIKGIEKAGFKYFKTIFKNTKNKIYPNYE
jgi:predicted GNAT family acetyltransferase